MAKVDIIVPVYNIEKYIDKCIRSLIKQSLDDVRIILVNDGSSDKSGEICDFYADKYEKIIVIHKENGGLSSARNAGLDICNAEYVGFVDGDDYVDDTMFESLYRNAKKYNADVSCCMMYDECDGISKARLCKERGLLSEKSEIIKFVLNNGAHACNKMFKRNVFDDLRFFPGKTYEDVWLLMHWVQKIDLMYIDERAMYHYVKRSTSISNMGFSRKKLNLIKSSKHNYDIISVNYPELKGLALKNVLLACMDIRESIYVNAKKDSRLLKYDKYYKRYVRNKILCLLGSMRNIKSKEIIRIIIGLLSINYYMYIRKMKDNV